MSMTRMLLFLVNWVCIFICVLYSVFPSVHVVYVDAIVSLDECHLKLASSLPILHSVCLSFSISAISNDVPESQKR